MLDNSIFAIVVLIGSILLSMTLHEAMHAYMSYWLGDDTARLQGRLSLNPIRHIDPFLTLLLPLLLAFSGAPVFGAAKPVPFNPNRVKYDEYGAALVGIAGPLTNLLLAIAAAGIVNVLGLVSGDALYVLFRTFIVVNIGFFVFNMIPFPPLDGSRLFYAFAPEPIQNVMQQIESYGLVGFAIFFFLLYQYLTPIIGDVMLIILQFLL